MAESLFVHERSFCPCGCGQPKRLAHDPDTEGWWQVSDVICEARAALDDAAESDKKDDPGTIRFVTMKPGYKPRPLPPAPPA